MGDILYITDYCGGDKMKMNGINEEQEFNEEKKMEIEGYAKKLFSKYGLKTPVDPVLLASKVNIVVLKGIFKELKGKEVLGVIRKDNDIHKIIVSRKEDINTQRFTIAHELGHYFLKHLGAKSMRVSLYRDSPISIDPLELEANYFAGCILVNADELRKSYKMFETLGYQGDKLVETLAQNFKVSKKTMEMRIGELNIKV